MILVGASWLLYWLLIDTFSITATKAALITGVILIVVALIFENRDWFHGRPA